MANHKPSWEEYDSKEDADTETETEEEEKGGESKDDSSQKEFESGKQGDNWLTTFIARTYESYPIEIQQPQRDDFEQNNEKKLVDDLEGDQHLPYYHQRNGFKQNDEKKVNYDLEGDQYLPYHTQRNGFKQNVKKHLDYDFEGDQYLPYQPQKNGSKQYHKKEFEYDKEYVKDSPNQELNPYIEKEQENGLEDGGKEREFKKDSEEVDINRKEYNDNSLNNTVEENEYVTDLFKYPIFKENVKENDLYQTSDEEDFQTNSEDILEEDDDINVEDIKFDYNDYPEEKPIPFGEDKPDEIDPEFLALLDGKDGEPDPNSFAPLNLLKGVRIGDKRWKEMMEQIMYTSPFEDYVPLENRPPHVAIWEKWQQTDFNEGRWVDEFEFENPNAPPDFKMDFGEFQRLAKLMQEGKPMPYDYKHT